MKTQFNLNTKPIGYRDALIKYLEKKDRNKGWFMELGNPIAKQWDTGDSFLQRMHCIDNLRIAARVIDMTIDGDLFTIEYEPFGPYASVVRVDGEYVPSARMITTTTDGLSKHITHILGFDLLLKAKHAYL